MKAKNIVLIFLMVSIFLFSCTKRKGNLSKINEENDFVLAKYGKYKIYKSQFETLVYGSRNLKQFVYRNHFDTDKFLLPYMKTMALYDAIKNKINKNDPEYQKTMTSFEMYKEYQKKNLEINQYIRQLLKKQTDEKTLKDYFNKHKEMFIRIDFNQIVLNYKDNNELNFKKKATQKIIDLYNKGKKFKYLYKQFNEDNDNKGVYKNYSPFGFAFLKDVDLEPNHVYTIKDNGKLRIIFVKKYTTFNNVKDKVFDTYVFYHEDKLLKDLEKKYLQKDKFISNSKRLFENRPEVFENQLWQKK